MIKKLIAWVLSWVLNWVDKNNKAVDLAEDLMVFYAKNLNNAFRADVQDALAGILNDLQRGIYGPNTKGYSKFVKNLKEK